MGAQCPRALAPPPESWATEFPAMARQAGLTTTDMMEAFDVLARFVAKLGISGPSP